MQTYMVFLWMALIVGALFCEAMTAALVSIWFLPAALVSMILAICEVKIWVQVLVFFLLSFFLLAVFQIFFRKRVKYGRKTATNADALIGKKVLVTSDINNLLSSGEVKVGGQVWSARSTSDDETIPAGTLVEIVDISGVRLICRKIL